MQSEYHIPAKPKQLNRETAHNISRPKAASLADHDAEYLLKRGVTEAVAKAAGYWTAQKPSEHPEAFSEHQRRRTPSLIAPHLSPDGVSVGYQKRDLRPGRTPKGKAIKWASPKDARLVLSTHPWTVDDVRQGTGRLWTPEGLSRLHALTGLGEVAVSYAGCHAWKQDGEPLRCFDHVNLNGRLVLDVPDADYRTNPMVQKALAERVAFLESRGARVLVVSVPEVNGDPTTGLDDYIAAGGNPETLVRDARPFVPVDAGRERLKRDEALRVFQAAKRREVEELPARKIGECGAVKVARYMVEVSVPAHGKIEGRGVVVHPSVRQIASGTRMGYTAARNALTRLESEGFLKLLNGPRGRHEAASYLLLYPRGVCALGDHIEERGTVGKGSQERRGEEEVSLYKRESLLCDLSVHIHVESERDAEKLPALRNSKLVHTWDRKNGRRVVVHSDYFKRYGAKGEEVLRHILEHGQVDVAELLRKFGSKSARRGRFYATWVKPMVDDCVIVGDAGSVEASPDWLEALERVRERTDEQLDNRLQDRKIADQQKAFRQAKDLPTDPTPELAGPERTAEIIAKAEERDHEARLEEQRRKVGMTAEVFLADALEGAISGFGWRELRALWMAKGGRAEDLRLAVKDPYRFNREGGDGHLYVERRTKAAGAVAEREPAPVALLREPKMPERVDGIYHHGPLCDCYYLCDSPVEPKYARPGSGA